jgi:ribosomal protein L40E
MMSISVKVCRDCGEEYRPEAVRCADCGGELEERLLDETGAVVGDEAPLGGGDSATEETAPPADHQMVFVTPRAAELVPLAEALRERELPYRLVERPGRVEGAPPQYALLVPKAEVPQALSALEPLIGSGGEGGAPPVDARFEPERGYLSCPACGAEQPPGALECGECGLGLGQAGGEEDDG